jgi:ParB family transcriptional regulator, chromosome partitioning protein
VEVARMVVGDGLSVRQTESLVRQLLAPTAEKNPQGTKAEGTRPDPNIAALQQDLTERLGAKVLIQQGRAGKGRLVVTYNSLDELDGILSHIR